MKKRSTLEEVVTLAVNFGTLNAQTLRFSANYIRDRDSGCNEKTDQICDQRRDPTSQDN